MTSSLVIPVSIATNEWLVEYRTTLTRLVREEVGLCWVCVDSEAEGDYLLEAARLDERDRLRAVCELRVDRGDPLLFWNVLFGTADVVSPLWEATKGTVALAFGATRLPEHLLTERAKTIAGYARSHGTTLLLPIYHAVHAQLAALELPLVAPERFESAPASRRRELARQLVNDSLASLEEGRRDTLISELLNARPNSRTELCLWIDHYAEHGVDGQRVPPPIERETQESFDIPTKQILEAHYKVAQQRFEDANHAFARWLGRPLFSRIIPPQDPFEGSDPVYWFVGSVTALSCRLFDAADPALEPLMFYRWDAGTSSIETSEVPMFYSVLRDHRTALQHGIDPHHPRNRRTLENVSEWLRKACGAPRLVRSECRRITHVLLREAEAAATRLAEVLTHVRTSPARDQVEAQLEIHARRIPKHEWDSLVTSVAEQCGAEIDVTVFVEKHLASFQARLKQSVAHSWGLRAEARKIVEEAVVAEISRCPVGAPELLDNGVPRGPMIGQLLAFAKGVWERGDARDAASLLAAVLDEWRRRCHGSVDNPPSPTAE